MEEVVSTSDENNVIAWVLFDGRLERAGEGSRGSCGARCKEAHQSKGHLCLWTDRLLTSSSNNDNVLNWRAHDCRAAIRVGVGSAVDVRRMCLNLDLAILVERVKADGTVKAGAER